MRLWNLVVAQVRSLVLRRRCQDELDEELQLHLDQEIAQHIARGMSPQEARLSALRAFGGFEKTKDECRDAWGLRLVDQLARDTRYATRRLARDWRFSLLAVLILALGIGANTAMFSVVNAMFSRPLPFRDAHRLVNIYQNDADSGEPLTTSYPAYEDMAAYTDLYAGTMAFSIPVPVRYYRDEVVRPGLAEFATSTYLEVLGLEPSAGRWFTEAEDRLGSQPMAVLSHRVWTTGFGRAPSVIGETVRINGAPVTVIGVGPEGHTSSFHAGVVTDFWLSIPFIRTVAAGGEIGADVLERSPPVAPFMVKARLRDDVSLPQAQAAMTALGARLASEFPDDDPGRGISVMRSDTLRVHPQFDGVLNYGATFLMTVVGLLLAIACTNLATWLLVRGLSRAKEVSVRLALGATRGQLVRQLLVESTLLAGVGGAAGCLLAVWAIRVVALMDLPLDAGVGLDHRVLVFSLALSLLTGVLFGLAPALKSTRVTLTPALRTEGDTLMSTRHGFTLKNMLVVSQVALSCVLLVWGGVFLQQLATGQTADLGFRVDDLAFVETDAGFAGHVGDEAAALYETVRDRIAALPGVESATRAARPPLGFSGTISELVIDGYAPADGEVISVRSAWAGPWYFETLQIPLLYGRSFSDFDRPGAPGVTVINESMARRYFGEPNAVGRRFRVAETSGATLEAAPGTGFEVIGVVPDTRTSVFEEPRPLFYRSFSQARAATPTVVVRTTLDPVSLLQPMQQTLRELGGGLPVISARTMSQHVADSLGEERTWGAFLGGLGALGLGLASLGLYAVMAFAVSRRAREIGIRMALGAQRIQVMWTVSRNVATLVGVGVATGLGLSWLSVRGTAAMSSSLSQEGVVNLFVPTVGLMTYVTVTALMVAVGLVAAFVPARRAALADPLVALREL
jgi:predicted permease